MNKYKNIILIDEDSMSQSNSMSIDINEPSYSGNYDREFYIKKIMEAVRESKINTIDCLIEIQKMKNDLISRNIVKK